MTCGHILTSWGPPILQGQSGHAVCCACLSQRGSPMTLADGLGLCAVAWAGICREISQLSLRGMGPLVSLNQVFISGINRVCCTFPHSLSPRVYHADIIRRMGIVCPWVSRPTTADQMKTGPG